MLRWNIHPCARLMIVTLLIAFISGCAGQKRQSSPSSSPGPTGGTTLLPGSFYTSYYSTQKARALGETYDKNLEQVLTQLTQSSIGKMQFANAIVSLSVGFFTHAASQPPDERYLEALIGMPDILDEEKDLSTHIGQLFSQYGHDVLSALAQDETIARDNKIAGYGIHFSWRGLTKTPSGPHLTMREAVLYFAKDQVVQFLSQQLSSDALLSRATLFSRRGEQPAEQVQYLVAGVQQSQAPPPQEENKEATPLPAPAEQAPVQEPPAASSSEIAAVNITSPIPTTTAPEPVPPTSAPGSPGMEVSNATPPLLESNPPTRRKRFRANKRKRWGKRLIRRPASQAPVVTTTFPAAVFPNQGEENQPSATPPQP